MKRIIALIALLALTASPQPVQKAPQTAAPPAQVHTSTVDRHTASVQYSRSATRPTAVRQGDTHDSDSWVHPLASGKRGNSCYRTANRPKHGGVDLAQPTGTPIRAASAGTVHRKAYEANGAGYYVLIKHANGIYTRYHHMRAHSPLPTGANVKTGQTIGYVGATGNATGPHLHYEVMRGGGSNTYRTNPATFMRAQSINIGC